MRTHQELMRHLGSVIETAEILEAFERTDRALFIDKTPYIDYPIPIGHGQTISQPTTVAIMLELLQVSPKDRVLDIGSGSGWTTALLSHLAREGSVYGIERIPELVELGKANLKRILPENATILRAGRTLGHQKEAPFDKILVSAEAERLPGELVEQLSTPGRMVIPIGRSLWLIEKDPDCFVRQTEYPGFAFVPLK